MDDPHAHVAAGMDDVRADLDALLRQPSISATGEGIEEAVDLVRRTCLAYGFDEARRIDTAGAPSVFARARADSDDAPTVLIYGHYDVQPADPEAWTSPPFEPTVRPGPDGRDRIYARGAGDNKGQWFAHLVAVDALRQTTGLPVNVDLFLEGEEESASPHLDEAVDAIADATDPDLIYVADGPIDAAARPHVIMGVRGIVYAQIDVEGPDRNLHSGGFGGLSPNPAVALIDILGSMWDETGRVTVDGFYDAVRPIADADREVLEAIPFDRDQVRESFGAPEFAHGPGSSPLERLMYYPTLNVCGFTSGYGGEGAKTIIPARATAKVDMRLVVDQDPADILDRFTAHVERHAPDTVDVEVSHLGSMAPHRTPVDHPVVAPIVEAVEVAWGDEPIIKPALGGSLPTQTFADAFGAPFVSVPYANPDEHNHSPDENLAIWCFENGIGTTIEVLRRLQFNHFA